MKSTFLCIVTLITCSGCVIGDLEFYPDYQRSDVTEEEWVKDQPLNPEFQNYLDEQRSALYQQERTGLPYLGLHRGKQSAELPWPSEAAQSIFKNQNLARRIAEITRKLEEPSRKPQYYFKTHGLSKEQENRYNAYNTFEDRNTGDFVPRFKPNFHILDDVRLNSDTENSDFSLPNDEVNVENEHNDRQQPPTDYTNARFDEEKNEGFEDKSPPKQTLIETSDDDPTEFAYPPSDPRYFEDSAPIEVKPPKDEENEGANRDSREDVDAIQIHNRNDDGYYHQQSLTGLRDPDRRHEDSLEVVAVKPHPGDDTTGVYIIAIVAGISAAATVGLIAFGIGWYNLQKHVKNASDVEYPAYGVTGPNKDISPSGDRRLAQSAQMYHYQHQKQQIIAMERAAASERHGSVSEADSDEENEEGDYTVYECPGLAPTGEMEVKNPLFQDDPTPAQTPAMKTEEDVQKK